VPHLRRGEAKRSKERIALRNIYVLFVVVVLAGASALAPIGAGVDPLLLCGFDSLSGLSTWSGSAAVDDLTFVEGVASVRLTASESTAQVAGYINVAPDTLKSLSLWVYIHDYSALSSLTLYVSSTSSLSKYLSAYLGSSVLTPGWNHLVFDVSRMSGSDSVANPLVRFSVRLVPVSGKTCRVSLDGFTYNEPEAAKAVFSFDDNLLTTYTLAKPTMDRYGYKGTFFIETAYVGSSPTSKMVSLGQLEEMYAQGWDVGGHTMTHADLSTATDLEYQVNGCYNWLIDHGFTRSASLFAYPYGNGFDNPATVAKLSEHFTLARTVKWDTYQGMTQTPNYGLKGYNIKATTTQTMLKEEVDRIVNQGGLLVFIFHGVTTGTPTSLQISLSNFEWLCGYLNQNGVEVVTMSSLLEQAPPPEPPPPTPSGEFTFTLKDGVYTIVEGNVTTSFISKPEALAYIEERVVLWG
jgi:peptidoglycan/xylan/chitin deacetylase (PgdA/CDA1 family)